MKAVAITVKGKVQGVYFRAFTLKKAEELKVKGFVKNLPEGHVFIHAEGEIQAIDTIIEWCKKGPILASVTEVLVENSEPKHFQNFTIQK
jgi:acylphosphatase